MLHLSTPEAIQAHKDYAQRTCGNCGVSIKHRGHQAKFCSNKCRVEGSKDNQRAYGRSEVKKAWRRKYRQTSEVHAQSKWSQNQKNSKLALRVNSMFTKATKSQRHRLADWLLRVHHKAINYYAVDDWLAEYNTSST